jgi:hypothetical protein
VTSSEKLAFIRIGRRAAPLTPDSLPPPNTRRWVARRKATVVAAVRANVISLDEACERYDLTVEEFRSWERVIDEHGVRGLRATRLGEIRKSDAANGIDLAIDSDHTK